MYSRASDIWQAGCILYLLLSAQYPFGSEATHTTIQILNNIKAINYNILASAPPPPPPSTTVPTATTTHIAPVPFPTTDTPPEPPPDLYTPNSSNGGHRLSAEVQDLFKRIFVKDPNKRITAGISVL